MTDRYAALAQRNLFQELMDLRDRQRREMDGALTIVKGSEIPIELNPWGRIQWYVHPTLTDTASRALLFWVMHIAPGSSTGELHCQGGHIYQVWRGTSGHTMLDGVRHEWARDCVLNIPLRPGGVTFTHYNDGDDEVKLLGSCLNLVDTLTLDAGSTFEVLKPCPEWEARGADA